VITNDTVRSFLDGHRSERHGLQSVAGACSLMFLEPVASVHRIQRSVRRARGAVEKAGS
jgi:hypothetical protein